MLVGSFTNHSLHLNNFRNFALCFLFYILINLCFKFLDIFYNIVCLPICAHKIGDGLINKIICFARVNSF